MKKDTSLSLYVKDLARVKLLTRDEEVALLKASKEGDTRARNRLIEANLGFVIKVAGHYKGLGLSIEDLVSEGNIGLITAIEKFDAAKIGSIHFISYAVWWIRQSITSAVYEARLVHLPYNKAQDVHKVKLALNSLNTKLHGIQLEKALSSMLNLSVQYIHELLVIGQGELSIDERVDDGGDTKGSIGDILVDPHSLDKELMQKALASDLNVAMAGLKEREKTILSLRYGLNGQKPHTLRETGLKCKISKERVRQIENRALLRLRHPSFAKDIKEYIA